MHLIIPGNHLVAAGAITNPQRFFEALAVFSATEPLMLIEGTDHPRDADRFYQTLGGVRVPDAEEELHQRDWHAFLLRADFRSLGVLSAEFPPSRPDDKMSHIHLFDRDGSFLLSFHDAFWAHERVLFGERVEASLVQAFVSAAGGVPFESEDSCADPEYMTRRILELASLLPK